MKLTPYFYSALFMLVAVFLQACGQDDDNTKNVEVQKEDDTFEQQADDELFASYRDSLARYFGTLEVNLIKQYKINHENLKNEEDFYIFYRNANTLRKSLNRSLNEYAKMQLQQGATSLHEIAWFNKIAKGLEILVKNEGRSYSMQFDYKDLDDHAEQTVGSSDDEFMKLLHLTYYDHSDTPRWLKIVSLNDNLFCSELGADVHLKALVQADNTVEKSEIFSKEVHKTKVRIISDILFNKRYCNSKEDVLQEIDNILTQVDLNNSEKKMLRERKEVLESNPQSIYFGCAEGDCPPLS